MRFRAFRQFNSEEMYPLARSRSRIGGSVLRHFGSNSLPDRLVRALGQRRALPCKEVLESFEFFEHVRSLVRAPSMADLFCGHGLVGMLFAVFEPAVERVVLLDMQRPPNHDLVVEAVGEVAPWAVPKVDYVCGSLRGNRMISALSGIGAVVAVHACGGRTDTALDVAMRLAGAVAVMPCCYGKARLQAPTALRLALGDAVACDVDRTYRLRGAGYQVGWTCIPPQISEMNRILWGKPG